MLTSEHSRVDKRRAMTAGFRGRPRRVIRRTAVTMVLVRSFLSRTVKPPVPTASPTFPLCLHQGACLCS